MTRYYLAGPMTGIASFNYPAFYAAARTLRTLGYTVVSPHELGILQPAIGLDTPDGAAAWADAVKQALVALLTCDAVIVLPGWETSRGAVLEVDVARRLGMHVYALPGASGVLEALGPFEVYAFLGTWRP